MQKKNPPSFLWKEIQQFSGATSFISSKKMYFRKIADKTIDLKNVNFMQLSASLHSGSPFVPSSSTQQSQKLWCYRQVPSIFVQSLMPQLRCYGYRSYVKVGMSMSTACRRHTSATGVAPNSGLRGAKNCMVLIPQALMGVFVA